MSIAYVLVGVSYIAVGALGYVGFAATTSDAVHTSISDAKDQAIVSATTRENIQQNFLDAFPMSYVFMY